MTQYIFIRYISLFSIPIALLLIAIAAQAGPYDQDEFNKIYTPEKPKPAALYLLSLDDIGTAVDQTRRVLQRGQEHIDPETYKRLGERYLTAIQTVQDPRDLAIAQDYYKWLFGFEKAEFHRPITIDDAGNIISGESKILKRNSELLKKSFKGIIVDNEGKMHLIPKEGKPIIITKGTVYLGEKGGFLIRDSEFTQGSSTFKGTFTILANKKIDTISGEINGLKMGYSQGITISEDGTISGTTTSLERIKKAEIEKADPEKKEGADNIQAASTSSIRFKKEVPFTYKPSGNVLTVSGNNEEFTITAKTILGQKEQTEKKLKGSFSGTIDIKNEQWIQMGSGTELKTYDDSNALMVSYSVTKPTDFFFGEDLCSISTRSCISQFDSLRVTAKNDNEIKIRTERYEPKDILVPLISDDSEVELDYHGKGKVTFSSEPLATDSQGLSEINSAISHYYRNPDKDNEVCEETYQSGLGSARCIPLLSYLGSRAANDILERNRISIGFTGIGKYYGSHMPDADQDQLKKIKIGDKPISTDCITYCRDIAMAIKKEMPTDLFDREIGVQPWKDAMTVYQTLVKNKGWTAVYFNPDTKNPRDAPTDPVKEPERYQAWAEQEKAKGGLTNGLTSDKFHTFTYDVLMKKGFYGYRSETIPIDQGNVLINYQPTEEYVDITRFPILTTPITPVQVTPVDQKSVELLKIIKTLDLGFVTNKWGYHVSFYSKGNIYEAHWKSSFKDPDLFEVTPIERFPWLDGVIVFPKGELEKAKKGIR